MTFLGSHYKNEVSFLLTWWTVSDSLVVSFHCSSCIFVQFKHSMNSIGCRVKLVSWCVCVCVCVCVCLFAVPLTKWCKRPIYFLRVFVPAELVKIASCFFKI